MIMASLKFIHQSLFTLYVRCVESITLTSCSFLGICLRLITIACNITLAGVLPCALGAFHGVSAFPETYGVSVSSAYL